jgi:hypothetical protein
MQLPVLILANVRAAKDFAAGVLPPIPIVRVARNVPGKLPNITLTNRLLATLSTTIQIGHLRAPPRCTYPSWKKRRSPKNPDL